MTHSRDKQNKNLVQFQYNRLAHLWNATDGQCRGGSRGGAIGAIAPAETYESNFFHEDFVQFGKQHSRYKAI